METMEITVDGKNYVPAEEYNKLLDKTSALAFENQKLNEQINNFAQKSDEMAWKLNHSIELPDCRPISVGKALIDMDRLFYRDGTEYEGFTRKQLRQIAEHLLVYCNEGKKQ